ncbi:MAG: hypothetical protein U0T02_08630 [Solirubrobacteraceae bacterium]
MCVPPRPPSEPEPEDPDEPDEPEPDEPDDPAPDEPGDPDDPEPDEPDEPEPDEPDDPEEPCDPPCERVEGFCSDLGFCLLPCSFANGSTYCWSPAF